MIHPHDRRPSAIVFLLVALRSRAAGSITDVYACEGLFETVDAPSPYANTISSASLSNGPGLDSRTAVNTSTSSAIAS